MNKLSPRKKLALLLLGPFVISLVALFFLYPHLHEDRYREVAERIEDEREEAAPEFDPGMDQFGGQYMSLSDRLDRYEAEEERMTRLIDSLQIVNEELLAEIEELREAAEEAEEWADFDPENPEEFVAAAEEVADRVEMDEEVAERVKSLLNLDEEELGPIVNQLSNDHLVRLYVGGGNIQREKLLRSLNPERAAEIMKKIML